MVADDEEIYFDPDSLIKRLAHDQLALFEPISAIMQIDVEEEEWKNIVRRCSDGSATPDDEKLGATMNHETYHFAQAAASGYMFDRQRTACRILNESPPHFHPIEDPANAELVARAREAAGDDPVAAARIERVLRLAGAHELHDNLKGRASPGDHSMAGPLYPDFFNHLRQRSAAEAASNAQGLSILGVIEGSAVIAAALLDPGPGDVADKLRAELATLAPVYSQLFAFTSAEAGERAIETALPATAVALCYARPHDAYCALLPMVASAPAGEAQARGRALFGSPPAIEAAGPWLGDALAQRDADDSYKIYDPFLNSLRADPSGVDCYDMLADPRAVYRTSRAPLAMVTRTGWHPGQTPPDELSARAYLMSIVRRAQSRVRAERDFWKDLQEWGLEARHRMFGGGD